MAKPASSRCNLNRRYGFYLEQPLRPEMDDATLALFIEQHIAAQPGPEVMFAWQGGEPTICELQFLHRVVALQKQHANGKQIHNTFRTNGLQLNDTWYQFFRDNGWLVGLSLDGTAESLDAYHGAKSTHHETMKALVKYGVDFNLQVVVNRLNSQQPQRLYRDLRQLGTPFLQFIPFVERDDRGELSAGSVQAEEWGAFLNAVFDIWVREDIGRVYIPLFDSTLDIWSGYPSQMCADAAQKNAGLVEECRQCPVLRFCHGDCPKHRIASGKSALCAGYRRFFTYSAPYMKTMRDLLKQHRSPMELMAMLNQSR